jgi:hypothetical protein
MLCVQPKTWGVTACKRASELQVKVATDLDSSQSSKVARPSAYRTPSPFLCQSSDFHVGKSSGFRARTMSETEGRTHKHKKFELFLFFSRVFRAEPQGRILRALPLYYAQQRSIKLRKCAELPTTGDQENRRHGYAFRASRGWSPSGRAAHALKIRMGAAIIASHERWCATARTVDQTCTSGRGCRYWGQIIQPWQ